MMYSLNEKREIEIFLDFKKSYDNRVWGLSYSTYAWFRADSQDEVARFGASAIFAPAITYT